MGEALEQDVDMQQHDMGSKSCGSLYSDTFSIYTPKQQLRMELM
jgi:hypothetical protein